MLFEKYLIDACAVTREQVIKASDIRRRSQPPIGSLAVQEKLLSRHEVESVLAAQQEDRQRFGEVAVGLGLLTSAGVESLLALQRERTPALSDVLVSMGAVDEDICDWVLEWYAHFGRVPSANENGEATTGDPRAHPSPTHFEGH